MRGTWTSAASSSTAGSASSSTSRRPEVTSPDPEPLRWVPMTATQLTPELEAAIQLGYERRDRTDMAPTIAYFEDLLARHPDHPVLVYEVGGAYDTAGDEKTAATHYERA